MVNQYIPPACAAAAATAFAAAASSFLSATRLSVVRTIAATDAAFSKAERNQPWSRVNNAGVYHIGIVLIVSVKAVVYLAAVYNLIDYYRAFKTCVNAICLIKASSALSTILTPVFSSPETVSRKVPSNRRNSVNKRYAAARNNAFLNGSLSS